MENSGKRYRIIETLYREKYKYLFKFFHTKTSDSELSRELTQETFAKLLEKEGIEHVERSEQKIYLQKCARNKLIDYYKKQERTNNLLEKLKHKLAIDREGAESCENQFLQAEILEVMHQCINSLDPVEKECFLRYYFENESLNSICCSQSLTRYMANRMLQFSEDRIREKISHCYRIHHAEERDTAIFRRPRQPSGC